MLLCHYCHRIIKRRTYITIYWSEFVTGMPQSRDYHRQCFCRSYKKYGSFPNSCDVVYEPCPICGDARFVVSDRVQAMVGPVTRLHLYHAACLAECCKQVGGLELLLLGGAL
jgi:hypothetical protein